MNNISMSDLFPPGANLASVRKLERNSAYAARLMHCADYEPDKLKFPTLLSNKIDGLFFQWHHEEGMWSKDGCKYPDWLVKYLRLGEVKYPWPICGDLYGSGLSLQNITRACGINRLTPGPNMDRIILVVHDVIRYGVSFKERIEHARQLIDDRLKVIWQTECLTLEDVECEHEVLVVYGAEGSVLHDPDALYVPGRSSAVMKHPDWKTGEYEIVEIRDGEGKSRGIAAVVTVNWVGKRCNIGTFRVNYEERKALYLNWVEHKQAPRVKIQWKSISAAGIPQNASLIQIL